MEAILEDVDEVVWANNNQELRDAIKYFLDDAFYHMKLRVTGITEEIS